MRADGNEKIFIDDYAQYPTWVPKELKILYKTSIINNAGQHRGDSLFIYDVTNKKRKFFFSFESTGNLNTSYFRFSPNNLHMSYNSQTEGELPQIWVMDLSNNTNKKLTPKGVTDIFSWSPGGEKIVYTQHDYAKWTYDNGVLWIIDINTGVEHQLTFNTKK